MINSEQDYNDSMRGAAEYDEEMKITDGRDWYTIEEQKEIKRFYKMKEDYEKYWKQLGLNITDSSKTPANECYQDLEDHRLWDAAEMIDKLIFLAHEIGNDQTFGTEVRKELKKWDSKKNI